MQKDIVLIMLLQSFKVKNYYRDIISLPIHQLLSLASSYPNTLETHDQSLIMWGGALKICVYFSGNLSVDINFSCLS